MAKEIKQIVGIEISEGTSKKTGQLYSIGTVYTMTRLAPPIAGNVSKGYMGDKYSVSVDLLRPIQHLSYPVNAELTTETVMRFGKREEMITEIIPVESKKS